MVAAFTYNLGSESLSYFFEIVEMTLFYYFHECIFWVNFRKKWSKDVFKKNAMENSGENTHANVLFLKGYKGSHGGFFLGNRRFCRHLWVAASGFT